MSLQDMDIEQLWDRARKQTEVIRMRMQDLSTVDATKISYIFLAESSLNTGDTVVRKGAVVIDRPSIILPGFSPQFQGFPLDDDTPLSQDALATFFLVRGIQFPSLKYQHVRSSLDVVDGSLQQAVRRTEDQLQRAEDIATGLVVGPEDAWQLSVLLLVGALVVRSADGDLRRILEDWRKRKRGG